MALAVASMRKEASVGFFVDRLRQGLDRDAHQVLGADLLLSSSSEFEKTWEKEAQNRGLKMAKTVVFPSMAIVSDGDNSRAKLVTLKAVTPDYPLRGQLKLQQGDQEVATTLTPAAGTAWIDPTLFATLRIAKGDKITIGELQLTVTQSIAYEPDRGSGFLNFSPRVMIAHSDLAASQISARRLTRYSSFINCWR